MNNCVIKPLYFNRGDVLKINSNFDLDYNVSGIVLRLYVESSYGPCSFYIKALKDFLRRI